MPTDQRGDQKLALQSHPDYASIAVTTTFEVWDTNYTPTNPTDDTLVYSQTYTTCNGDGVTTCIPAWEDFYTIPNGAHAGNWKVRVFTQAGEAKSYGVNAFGIRAAKGGVWALCDGRTDGTCPGVAGDSNLAVLLNIPAVAEFYLARLRRPRSFAASRYSCCCGTQVSEPLDSDPRQQRQRCSVPVPNVVTRHRRLPQRHGDPAQRRDDIARRQRRASLAHAGLGRLEPLQPAEVQRPHAVDRAQHSHGLRLVGLVEQRRLVADPLYGLAAVEGSLHVVGHVVGRPRPPRPRSAGSPR